MAYSTPRAAPVHSSCGRQTRSRPRRPGSASGRTERRAGRRNVVSLSPVIVRYLRGRRLPRFGVAGVQDRPAHLPDHVARGLVDEEDRVEVAHRHEHVAEVRARRVLVDRDRVAVVDVRRVAGADGGEGPRWDRNGVRQPCSSRPARCAATRPTSTPPCSAGSPPRPCSRRRCCRRPTPGCVFPVGRSRPYRAR